MNWLIATQKKQQQQQQTHTERLTKVGKWLLFMLFLSPAPSLPLKIPMRILRCHNMLTLKKCTENLCAVRLKMTTTTMGVCPSFFGMQKKNMEFNFEEFFDKNMSAGRPTNRTKYFKTFFRKILQFYFSLFMLGYAHLEIFFCFVIFFQYSTSPSPFYLSHCVLSISKLFCCLHLDCWICMILLPISNAWKKRYSCEFSSHQFGIYFTTHTRSIVAVCDCESHGEFLMRSEVHMEKPKQQPCKHTHTKLEMIFVCWDSLRLFRSSCKIWSIQSFSIS